MQATFLLVTLHGPLDQATLFMHTLGSVLVVDKAGGLRDRTKPRDWSRLPPPPPEEVVDCTRLSYTPHRAALQNIVNAKFANRLGFKRIE